MLLAYGASGLEYDDWLKVGQALHHQYRGSDYFEMLFSDEFSVLEDEEDFTRDLPLNMSDDEVKGLLSAYGASGLEYDLDLSGWGACRQAGADALVGMCAGGCGCVDLVRMAG